MLCFAKAFRLVFEKGTGVIEKTYNKDKLQLDFQVNEFARSLRMNKSMTVGVLLPELDNIFSTRIVSEVENILMEHGYSTLICDYKNSPALERSKLQFLTRKMADALVVMPTHLTAEDFADINKPVVCLDRPIEQFDCDRVLVDNRGASASAVQHLVAHGHERIGILCGPREVYTVRNRLAGYREALLQAGITPDESLILFGDYDVKTGHRLTRQLMQSENPPTALIATNFDLTTGMVIALNELDLRIPDDISVVGFDHAELASAMRPHMSVVLQPIQQIGQEVANLLLDRLQGGTQSMREIVMPTCLTQGQSAKHI